MTKTISRTSRLAAALVLLALLVPLRWSSMRLAAEQRVVDPNALPKFPPVAARDALNTFQLRKGFRLELVAAEPLVTDPIALAFDEDGRFDRERNRRQRDRSSTPGRRGVRRAYADRKDAGFQTLAHARG